MKPETKFRVNRVNPFVKTLEHTHATPIQQSSFRGDADNVLCVRGFFVWLELKTDEGELTALQKWKASCVEKAGGIVIVARPHNWEDVKTFLKLLDGGIYDKNALRGIEQSSISPVGAKTSKYPDEKPKRGKNHAHRKTPGEAP